MAETPLVAGVDAGGTTFKLAVAPPGERPASHVRVDTTTPERTVTAAATALRALAAGAGGRIEAVGIASFGPVDIDPVSPRYGTVLATPKPGWTGTPLLGALAEALGVPGVIQTDVNGALLAERRWGAAKDAARAAYVTVGTGIGVGIANGDGFAGAPRHPELGHVRVARARGDDYPGRCPFHADCLEGMAAAPALADRFGALEALDDDAPAWPLLAIYLAQLTLTLSLAFRLDRIVLGGGVMNAPGLLDRVRRAHAASMAGYVADPPGLIARAALGDEAGVAGACLLASDGAFKRL